jgi:hypothetical protein
MINRIMHPIDRFICAVAINELRNLSSCCVSFKNGLGLNYSRTLKLTFSQVLVMSHQSTFLHDPLMFFLYEFLEVLVALAT